MRTLFLVLLPLTAWADVAPSGGCRCDLVSGSVVPGVVLVAIALVALSRR